MELEMFEKERNKKATTAERRQKKRGMHSHLYAIRHAYTVKLWSHIGTHGDAD